MGIIAAQIVHAAGESSTGSLSPGTYAVALSAKDEPQLLEVAERLGRAGLDYRVIRESTGPWAGEAMAIGVRPGPKDTIRRYVSSLPLIK